MKILKKFHFPKLFLNFQKKLNLSNNLLI